MKNIKTITIDCNEEPVFKPYNGSYNPIEHTSTDGNDYSITIWECFYASVEHLFGEDHDVITTPMSTEAWEITLEQFEDFGVKLIKE